MCTKAELAISAHKFFYEKNRFHHKHCPPSDNKTSCKCVCFLSSALTLLVGFPLRGLNQTERAKSDTWDQQAVQPRPGPLGLAWY